MTGPRSYALGYEVWGEAEADPLLGLGARLELVAAFDYMPDAQRFGQELKRERTAAAVALRYQTGTAGRLIVTW